MRTAFATFLMLNDNYLPGCLVLAGGLRRQGVGVPLFVLVTDDVSLAADQFAELCKADLWPKAVFGLQTEFTQSERDRIVDGAVATCLPGEGGTPVWPGAPRAGGGRDLGPEPTQLTLPRRK